MGSLSYHPGENPGNRSILEIRGLGKDIWETIDVPGYIEHERESWVSKPGGASEKLS